MTGELVGMVASDDLLGVMANEMNSLAKMIQADTPESEVGRGACNPHRPAHALSVINPAVR